jgi:hypothetical protein
MTAHTRTASLASGFQPATTALSSTSRFVVVAAGVLLQAVIVLGFVASSLGIGGATYPDPGPGRLTPPAAIAPVSAIEVAPATSDASGPQPAPAPAP